MGRLAINDGVKVRSSAFPAWPNYSADDEAALLRVLHSGKWCRTAGSETAAFEDAFAKYQDARFGVAAANGSIALKISLQAAGLDAGGEVIVPPYTFLATATSVVESNGTPIFADIDPETYCLDAAKVEAAITPRTRGIIPVHLAGQAADMDAIMELARRRGLFVIEDAAHAHGAEYKGRKLGSIGDIGCFSFQISKNLTAGEGGIILTDDEELEIRCRSIHNCGRSAKGAWYNHEILGSNYRMTEFQSALLMSQMTRLEEQTVRRNENGLYLNEQFAEIPGIRPLQRNRGETRHSYHLYIFRYDSETFGASRDTFLSALNAEGIPSFSGYGPPLYKQLVFANKAFGSFDGYRKSRPDLDYRDQNCPVCEKACREACWIAHSVLLGTKKDMDDIVAAVGKIYDNRDELKKIG